MNSEILQDLGRDVFEGVLDTPFNPDDVGDLIAEIERLDCANAEFNQIEGVNDLLRHLNENDDELLNSLVTEIDRDLDIGTFNILDAIDADLADAGDYFDKLAEGVCNEDVIVEELPQQSDIDYRKYLTGPNDPMIAGTLEYSTLEPLIQPLVQQQFQLHRNPRLQEELNRFKVIQMNPHELLQTLQEMEQKKELQTQRDAEILKIIEELESEYCTDENVMANNSMPTSGPSNSERLPRNRVIDVNMLQESDPGGQSRIPFLQQCTQTQRDAEILEIYKQLQSEDCPDEFIMANNSMLVCNSGPSNSERLPRSPVIDGDMLQESDLDDQSRIPIQQQSIQNAGKRSTEKRRKIYSTRNNKENYDEKGDNEDVDTVVLKKFKKSNVKPFQCDICQQRFRTKSEIAKHIQVQHVKRRTGDGKKTNAFVSIKKPLKQHELNQSVEKPFACDVCKKSFGYKSNLTKHLMIHDGDKPFTCEVCYVSFRLKQHLEKHLMIHNGEKPYKCEVCHMSFRQKSHLESHSRIHSGEKPYICNVCNESFRQRQHLSYHLLIHTNEKPHSCIICKKSFRQRTHLSRHLKTHNVKNQRRKQ